LAIKDFEISIDQAEKIQFKFEYKYSIKIIKDNETFAEELNKHCIYDNRLIQLSNYKNSIGIILILIKTKFKNYITLKKKKIML
jgi:hypothetical protein